MARILGGLIVILLLMGFWLPTANPPLYAAPLSASGRVAYLPTSTPAEIDTYEQGALLSPNGKWRATTMITQPIGDIYPTDVTFALVNPTTNEVIVIEEIHAEENGAEILNIPVAVAWSPYNQYLYYTYSPAYRDGCTAGSESTLHRYSVASGTSEHLLERAGSRMTFSPDGSMMAYFPYVESQNSDPTFAIYDINNDTLRDVPFPKPNNTIATEAQNVSGHLLWHPDGERIAVMATLEPCIEAIPLLVVVNVESMGMEVLEIGGEDYLLEGWQQRERWQEDSLRLRYGGGGTSGLQVSYEAHRYGSGDYIYTFPSTEATYGYNALVSPNGKWTAFRGSNKLVSTVQQGFLTPNIATLSLISTESNVIERVDAIGVGKDSRLWQVPTPRAWSPDSQTFYYTYSRFFTDGCQTNFDFSLHQYTPETGISERVGTWDGQGYTFDAEKRNVAYFPYNDSDQNALLVLYNLEERTETPIPFPPLENFVEGSPATVGEIWWHPTGEKVVVMALLDPCGQARRLWAVVDTATSEMTVLEMDGDLDEVEGWRGDEIVLRTGRDMIRVYDTENGVWVDE